MLCLPTAAPKPGAAGAVREEARHGLVTSRHGLVTSRHGLVTSRHHGTLEGLKHAVSGYFRTCPIRVDTCKFLYRSI